MRIKEILSMMDFLSEKACDQSIEELVRHYKKIFKSMIISREEERLEIEGILVDFADNFYDQSALMQLYREEAVNGIPGELPDLGSHLINENLEKIAKTSKYLTKTLATKKDELSVNESDNEDLLQESLEQKRTEQMNHEINQIVDKEINEFFKPQSLLTQEILNEKKEYEKNRILVNLSPKGKKSATATMNTSLDQTASLDQTWLNSSDMNSNRIPSSRQRTHGDVGMIDGTTDVSVSMSPQKTSARLQRTGKSWTKTKKFNDKWHTPLGNHESICKAVRDNAETTMHKKLGEIIIDSFKNDFETCRPLSE